MTIISVCVLTTVPLLLCFFEISKVRWCLVLLSRHQEPIAAYPIVFIPDDNIRVALGARRFAPDWTGIGVAPVSLVDAPRPRRGVVEHGDFVMKNVRIVLVEMKPLLEG